MKTFNLLLAGMIFFQGCVAMPQSRVGHRRVLSARTVTDTRTQLAVGEDVKVSLLGFNQRDWQSAETQDFQWPIKWLLGEKLSDRVYVVKQVGQSFLFCLISPLTVSVSKKKGVVEYSIFLVQSMTELPRVPMKKLNLDGIEIQQIRLSEESYWMAPAIVVNIDEQNFQFTRIYRGVSRSYAERLMNKFPWRSVAQQ